MVVDETIWLVATLAPRAVAPHPNFTRDEVTGPALLAVAADFRLPEFDRYRKKLRAESERDLDLPVSAFESLLQQTQRDALVRLERAARNADFPFGYRAAAALFASAALAELDAPNEAVPLIEEIAAAVSHGAEPQHEGSRRLVLVALQHQLALRLLESGRRDEVWGVVNQLKDLLAQVSDAPPSAFEDFETSPGVSWDSAQTCRDLIELFRVLTNETQSHLEGFEGQAWIEVVRGRSAWLDDRRSIKLAGGLQSFVKEAFVTQLAGVARKRAILGSPSNSTELPVGGTLLASELSGDVVGVRQYREVLGRVKFLSSELGADADIADAIRLLRQANSLDSLNTALRWVRAQGPNSILVAAARAITNKSSYPNNLSRSDMAIFEAAAELLPSEDLRACIEGAITFLSQSYEGGLTASRARSWVLEESAWKAIRSLLPGSGLDSIVAGRAVESLRVNPGQSLANVLASLVETIDWSEIPLSSRRIWLDWAKSEASAEFDVRPLAEAIIRSVSGAAAIREALPRAEGILLGVQILNELDEGLDIDDSEVRVAIETCIDALTRTREEAARGQFSFGGVNAAALLAALLQFSTQQTPWEKLAEFLTDRRVSADDKTRALDYLAFHKPIIPSEAMDQIREGWPNIWTSAYKNLFDANQSFNAFIPSALRFGISYDQLDRITVIQSITHLAGSGGVEGRVEAARCISTLLGTEEASEWAFTLLVQLTHDNDPVVRAEAGRVLAAGIGRAGNLAPLVEKRLEELLDAEGVLCPVLVARGLTLSQLPLATVGGEDWLNQMFSKMLAHPVRSVRAIGTSQLRR